MGALAYRLGTFVQQRLKHVQKQPAEPSGEFLARYGKPADFWKGF